MYYTVQKFCFVFVTVTGCVSLGSLEVLVLTVSFTLDYISQHSVLPLI